jgi:DNA (cytosine-5)-methyltransferase 1
MFVIPSIDEVNANAGKNGLTTISTFAGSGGSSTGYKMAGFDVRVACEFVQEAADTYRANAPKTTVIQEDIRNVSGRSLLDAAGLAVGELDVLDGSPPCSAFSMAGLREDGWGAEKQYSGSVHQRVDDLFFEFIRLCREIQPRVFVAENVPGLAVGDARGYLKEIHGQLIESGYRVGAQIIEGVRLGVPQKRSRLIFIGVRNDLERDPVFPRPLVTPPVAIQTAIAGLPAPERKQYDILREGTRTRLAWDYTDLVRDGGCFRHAYVRLFNKDARYMWFKVNPSEPCPTVTAKIPTLFRWDEPRTLSIPEIKRICTFPDDYKLTGNFKQQWERLGRAVPPFLMRAVAGTIAKEIFGR